MARTLAIDEAAPITAIALSMQAIAAAAGTPLVEGREILALVPRDLCDRTQH